MKILSSIRRKISGQVLAEACIGLCLMTFTWILISYSMYLGTYSIRTEMAARYAAWFQANNGGTAATSAQLDQYFFFQPNLSTVTGLTPALIGDVIEGNMPTNASTYSDGDGSKPFKVQVTFGPTTTPTTSSPFPFNLLSSGGAVPLMPTNSLSVYSVNSACQWDDDSDLWTNASQAAEGVWNSLEQTVSSFM